MGATEWVLLAIVLLPGLVIIMDDSNMKELKKNKYN